MSKNQSQVTAPSPEEIAARRAQIYMQKRETFALNALGKIIDQRNVQTTEDAEKVAKLAVDIADALLVKLYADEDKQEGTDPENQS